MSRCSTTLLYKAGAGGIKQSASFKLFIIIVACRIIKVEMTNSEFMERDLRSYTCSPVNKKADTECLNVLRKNKTFLMTELQSKANYLGTHSYLLKKEERARKESNIC